MAELLSFLIVITAGLFLSELFRKFHLPYVIGLIITGILIGPYVLNVIQVDATIEFIGSIGLIFLMFMAGLQIRMSSLERLRGGVLKLSLLNGLLPFVVGFLVASYFGYSLLASFLLGIIFISSSIAIVIPTLDANKLLGTRVGKTIVTATVFEDVFSLVLLSIVLQTINPTTFLPLPIFYLVIFAIFFLLKNFIPKAKEMFFSEIKKKEHFFEQELRFIFVVLIGTVVLFELLGMHSIIAGFFAGLILADSIKSSALREKLHAISYGLFIPVFFIVIGTETDITVFGSTNGALLLTAAILIGSIGSKFASGWLGGRLIGFSSSKSALIGSSTIPQLSTTLAVAFVGYEFGLLDHRLITAMVILSIVTTFAGPLLMSRVCPECRLPGKKRK